MAGSLVVSISVPSVNCREEQVYISVLLIFYHGAARVLLANFSMFTVESPKPGFISVEILTDTVEGEPLGF